MSTGCSYLELGSILLFLCRRFTEAAFMMRLINRCYGIERSRLIERLQSSEENPLTDLR